MTEAQPNPYNARKDWHVADKEVANADSLFIAAPTVAVAPDPSNEATQDVNYKKRYDDLKQHYDRKLKEHEQEMAQNVALASVESNATVDTARERVTEFEQANPNVASVVRDITDEQTKDLRNQLKEANAREDASRKLEAKRVLADRHPDFATLAGEIDFQNWTESQPQAIQDWILKNPFDGELAARAIDLYKQDRGLNSAPVVEDTLPLNRQDAANLVPTRQAGADASAERKVWSLREIEALKPWEYEKFEKEIDLAVDEGRVVR